MKYKRDKVVDAVEIPGLTLLLLVKKNTNNGQKAFPSCFNDDWILSVGGSDIDGNWNSDSRFGDGMDFIAPNTFSQNYTTNIGNSYSAFYGTSASSAFVSGLSALLLSYMNNSSDPHDYRNLAPEDVEEIIQRSCWLHPNYTGYDDHVGWGRIDMGAALNLVDKNYARVLHFNNYDFSTTYSLTQESGADINLKLIDDVPNSSITAGNYKAEVWKMEEIVQHNITLFPNETIAGFWSRSSASASFPLYYNDGTDNILDPYEKAYVDEVNLPADENEATIWGYYYKLKDPVTSSFISWVPSNPGLSPNAKMSYTILTRSTTPTSIQQTSLSKSKAFVYPNPANNSFTMVLEGYANENVKATLYDSFGQSMRVLYNSNSALFKKEFDVSYLPVGVYLIRIESEGESNSIKLTIAK